MKSQIGFGSYRIDNRIEEHFNSLKKAIEYGITTVDTSANYSDGRSEILIGNVLNDLAVNGGLRREDFFLITKVGYIQGANYNFALKKKEQGNPFPEVVELENGLWHCIHPDFLEDQLSRQLHRLDQNEKGYIDLYLLHNTEYFLKYARMNAYEKEDARKIYYSRIKKAFEFFEEKVKQGKIKQYGISSNTFPLQSILYDFTSLEKIYEIANSVSPDNHFKYIQFPFNLIESSAFFEKNQCGNTKTILEYASEKGIKVIVNRPLNAITEKGLVRLSDFPCGKFDKAELMKYIELTCSMEEDFLIAAESNLNLEERETAFLKSNFNFGHIIQNNWDKFGSIEFLNDHIEFNFSHKFTALIDFFEERVKDDYFIKLFERYLKFVFKLLNLVTWFYKEKANKRSEHIHSLIDKHLEKDFQGLTLSQKAIMIVKSVKGVDCVLAGARKEKYVDDVKGVLDAKTTKHYAEILSTIKEEVSNENGL